MGKVSSTRNATRYFTESGYGNIMLLWQHPLSKESASNLGTVFLVRMREGAGVED